MDYFSILQTQFGIPIWLIAIIFAWSFIWKLLALWKSAKKNNIVWFIVLAIVNTVGILEILYIYVFSEMKISKKKKSMKKKIPSKKIAKKK